VSMRHRQGSKSSKSSKSIGGPKPSPARMLYVIPDIQDAFDSLWGGRNISQPLTSSQAIGR